MRCEDLTRELASPTGQLSSAQMADHLAGCPSCAGWSRQAAKFDRIWEETRPVEPTLDAMDALWARASVALDEQPVSATLRLEGLSHRRSWLKPALFVAQLAAAALVAGFFFLHQAGNQPAKVAVKPPAPVESVEVVVALPPAPTTIVPHPLVAEHDKPLLVSIDKSNGFTVTHLEVPVVDSSMLPDHTQHDLFDELESQAILASSVAIR